MSTSQIEARLAAVEKQLADIRTLLEERLEPKKDWRSTYGMFTGDPIAKEVAEEILKAREAGRKRVDAKPRKKQARRKSA